MSSHFLYQELYLAQRIKVAFGEDMVASVLLAEEIFSTTCNGESGHFISYSAEMV